LEQFEAHLESSALASATVINYLADLRAFLRWCDKEYGSGPKGAASLNGQPFDLGVSDIESFCSYLQETKNQVPATVNRRIQTLRKFYDFAVEQGWASSNPASEVQLLTEVVSERTRSLTDDDISRLLAAVRRAPSRRSARDWAIIQVLLRAGLKLGELTELCLADVRLEIDRPHLCVRGPAEEEVRHVPVEAEVHAALRAYLPMRQASPGVEHLFVNRDGNPLSTRTVQRLLHQYARTAGLDSLTSQALRYVYATRLYEECGDLDTVAHRLGHRHLATTIRYLRSSAPGEE
jgi:integrase/recombinase XerC